VKFDPVVIGDTAKALGVQLGGLANLDAVASIAVHVWFPGLPVTTIAATIVSSPLRTISFNIGAFLTNVATQALTYFVEYELTYTSGLKETWPPEPDLLPVRAQGA